MKVYTYTMTHDNGFAPAVFNGVLSLACCAPQLRYTIGKEFKNGEKEIYIVGLCGKQLKNRSGLEGEYYPVYIAKVSRVLPTVDYFSPDSERPDAKQYRCDGEWVMCEGNPHCPDDPSSEKGRKRYEEARDRDIYYRRNKNVPNNVLLCDEYIYYGKNQEKLLVPPVKKISEERKNACRAKGEAALSEREKELFVDFFNTKYAGFDKKKKVHFIDGYFLDCRGGCGK